MALILPNSIANGQVADGDKLDQNFQAVQTHVNAEVITRDGQVAMTGPLLLPGPPTAPNQAATKAYVDSVPVVAASLPIGSQVLWHTSKPVPAANVGTWMVTNGAQISRTTYSALFAIIGTMYGTGNGSTTFHLPNRSTYLIKVL